MLRNVIKKVRKIKKGRDKKNINCIKNWENHKYECNIFKTDKIKENLIGKQK